MSVNIKYDYKKFIEDTFVSFYIYDPHRSEFADELNARGLVSVERIGDEWNTVAWRLCFSYDAAELPRKPKARRKTDYINIIIDCDGVSIMPLLTSPRPIKDSSWEAINKVAKEIQKRLTRYIVENQEDE